MAQNRLRLSDATMKDFRLGDLFTVNNSKKVDLKTDTSGKLKFDFLAEKGSVPVVGQGCIDNGVRGYVNDLQKGSYLWPPHSITVNVWPGIAYYQDESFYDLGNISILTSNRINFWSGSYIVSQFNSTVGGTFNRENTASANKLRATILTLPSTPQGTPDYDFMSCYMAQVRKDALLDTAAQFGIDLTAEIDTDDSSDIDLWWNKKWEEFRVGDLFTITGTKTTKQSDLEKCGVGEFPYVTTQATNNGVAGNYDIATEKGNCLVAESAVLGYVTYQEKDFSASDHVEKLTPRYDGFNKYHGLFITSVLRHANDDRYDFGYKFNQARIKESIIQLPVTTPGQPDYDFMERYMASIEGKIKKDYATYIKGQIAECDAVLSRGTAEK